MSKPKNKYTYEVQGGSVSGFFNIYQAKSGKIYILMGNNAVPLTKEQVLKLSIDVYSLEDFDYDQYLNAYKEEQHA